MYVHPRPSISLAGKCLRIAVGAMPNRRFPGSKRSKFGDSLFPHPYALALMFASCLPRCTDFQRDVILLWRVSGQRGEDPCVSTNDIIASLASMGNTRGPQDSPHESRSARWHRSVRFSVRSLNCRWNASHLSDKRGRTFRSAF